MSEKTASAVRANADGKHEACKRFKHFFSDSNHDSDKLFQKEKLREERGGEKTSFALRAAAVSTLSTWATACTNMYQRLQDEISLFYALVKQSSIRLSLLSASDFFCEHMGVDCN